MRILQKYEGSMMESRPFPPSLSYSVSPLLSVEAAIVLTVELIHDQHWVYPFQSNIPPFLFQNKNI